MSPFPNPEGFLDEHWARIRKKLETHKHILAKHGVVTTKVIDGRTVWRVRFSEHLEGGRIVRRTIHIGSSPVLVERTRLLFQALRAETKLLKETNALVKLAMGLKRALGRGVLQRSKVHRRAAKSLETR